MYIKSFSESPSGEDGEESSSESDPIDPESYKIGQSESLEFNKQDAIGPSQTYTMYMNI